MIRDYNSYAGGGIRRTGRQGLCGEPCFEVVLTGFRITVAIFNIGELSIGTVLGVVYEGLCAAIYGGINTGNTAEGIITRGDYASAGCCHAGNTVKVVIEVSRAISNAQLCGGLLFQITEVTVGVGGTSAVIGNKAQFADAFATAGGGVVGHADVFCGAGIINGGDAIEGVVGVGDGDAAGVGDA